MTPRQGRFSRVREENMARREKCICAIILCLGIVGAASIDADVRLPEVFGDHMVLQRGMRIPIWGSADPGERIIVSMGGRTARTTAGKDGRWKVKIPRLDAGGPYELIVSGKNTLTLRDVLVGEVWVCSGQSNMWWPVERVRGIEQIVSAADYPDVRLFSVWSPEHDSYGKRNEWSACTPETVREFSAAAFFFGRELYREMRIPIGLIHTSMGGSVPEAWMTRKTLASDSAFRPALAWWDSVIAADPGAPERFERYLAQLRGSKREGGPEPDDPGLSFVPRPLRFYMRFPEGVRRAQLEPILGYGMRGVIWFQGESSIPRAWQYRKLFPAMIREWRRDWGQGDFPFVFTQLANYKSDPLRLPELREAQSMSLSLKNTAMAVTIDIGDEDDVHFNNKWDVGRRLALAALGTTYKRDIVYSGPVYRSMRRDGSAIRLRFDHTAGGLVSKGNDPPGDFIIAGQDRVFHPAEARIAGREVIVSSPRVPKPVAVRYGWRDVPKCRLYNSAGLPASPFRTDTWNWVTKDVVIPDPG